MDIYKMKRIIKNTIVAALVLSLVLTSVSPVFFPAAYADSGDAQVAAETVSGSGAEDASSPDATTITGYSTNIAKAYKKSVRIKATISPAAGGRTVKLQRYNSAGNKWTTIKKVRTKSASSASVSFSIPKKQRKKTTSVWRLYVPAAGGYKAAVSQDITLTTRNIKSYKMSARAACIYRIDGEGNGTLIYTKNTSKKLAQASTTKLMTAVLLIESGLLDTTTTVSKHAASTPWGSGHMKEGDVFNTRDLLYAMLVCSSNDAATAVAERVSGTEDAFVALMNSRAREMGMANTHFRNPHGLDASGHYTTASDLAKLTAYAYTFPEIRQCWATGSKTIKTVNTNKKWTLRTTNAILSYVKNFLGGKTGTEDNAKCCFAGVYKYKGTSYVTVVLGSGYGFSRWADTKKLHKYIRKYAAKRY